jgi:uncharacterized membrane protein (DUF485 family)
MDRRYLAVSASIMVIWLAVLFISVFAPDLRTTDSSGEVTSLPLAGIVSASFAFVATIVIAAVGFVRGRDYEPDIERERFERERLELRVRELEEHAGVEVTPAA